MSRSPHISVVMTVFNAGPFLREAVESILNQTWRDFQFVIVDNKSTDGSLAILRSYADPRVVLVENSENVGQTRALNIGLRHSQGKYIARMDANEAALPERLARQHGFLEKNPDIAVVGTWRLDIDRTGRSLRVFRGPTDPLSIRCCLAASGELTNWCISHPTVMIRKEALEKVGGYTEFPHIVHGFPQDYDLWAKMLMRDFQFANLPDVLLKYRIVEHSESRQLPKSLLDYRLQISRNKILFYLPKLNGDAVTRLVRLLEFLPQQTPEEGKDVLELFDVYFDAVMGENRSTREALAYRQRMKFYYLPVLSKTNGLLSLKKFFQLNCLNPRLMFDGRFYRKVVKAFLANG